MILDTIAEKRHQLSNELQTTANRIYREVVFRIKNGNSTDKALAHYQDHYLFLEYLYDMLGDIMVKHPDYPAWCTVQHFKAVEQEEEMYARPFDSGYISLDDLDND